MDFDDIPDLVEGNAGDDDDDDPPLDLPALADNIPALMAALCSLLVHRQQILNEIYALVLEEADEENYERPKQRRRVEPRPEYDLHPWTMMLDKKDDLSDPTKPISKTFRNRFRVPYPIFTMLLEATKDHGWFGCGSADASGRPGIPVELKLLAVLRILGRGACYDDISELSSISTSSVGRILHEFCSNFAKDMYAVWVKTPQTDEELSECMRPYSALGIPGAVASGDVTHFSWDKTPSQQARHFTGKEGFPTVAYQVCVDHSLLVMSCTQGFAGACNDKTIVRYDMFVDLIKEDKRYTDMTYQLRSANGFIRMKGVYIIVDGGYHKVRDVHISCPCQHQNFFPCPTH